jgi:hypothetical protein
MYQIAGFRLKHLQRSMHRSPDRPPTRHFRQSRFTVHGIGGHDREEPAHVITLMSYSAGEAGHWVTS